MKPFDFKYYSDFECRRISIEDEFEHQFLSYVESNNTDYSVAALNTMFRYYDSGNHAMMCYLLDLTKEKEFKLDYSRLLRLVVNYEESHVVEEHRKITYGDLSYASFLGINDEFVFEPLFEKMDELSLINYNRWKTLSSENVLRDSSRINRKFSDFCMVFNSDIQVKEYVINTDTYFKSVCEWALTNKALFELENAHKNPLSKIVIPMRETYLYTIKSILGGELDLRHQYQDGLFKMYECMLRVRTMLTNSKIQWDGLKNELKLQIIDTSSRYTALNTLAENIGFSELCALVDSKNENMEPVMLPELE